MNLISRAMFATPISFCFCFSRSIQSVLWKLGLLIFEQNKKIEWGFHHFYQHNCWSVCTSNLDAVKLYINLKMAVQLMLKFSFYRTRVRSLVMLVSDSLTDWLTNWLPFSKLKSDHCLPLSLTHWLTDWLAHSVAFLVIEFWALTLSLLSDCLSDPSPIIVYPCQY